MDTAKVDIRRLQMLNDRINQTLDALNQVRMTVHGIGHSSVTPGMPFGSQFAGGQFGGSQFAGSPMGGQFQASPYGTTPWGQSFGAYPYGPQGFVPGVSHSSPFTSPSPFAYGSVNPAIAQQWGLGLGGLSHTSPESMMDPTMGSRSPIGYDPYYVQRVAQTFPFAQWGYSPFSHGIV